MAGPGTSATPTTAAVILVSPSGNRRRAVIDPVPFSIGRQPGNALVIRDNRVSRTHARIVVENARYYVEDLKSSHGVHVNGVRITRHELQDSDRIDFGIPDSYSLIFSLKSDEIQRIIEQFSSAGAVNPVSANMQKLRALVEVARALQNSLSPEDVLASVVDAALAVTAFDRGFLLLNQGGDLDIRVARNRSGVPLDKSELQVPMQAIHEALRQRRELLSMTFGPRTTQFMSDTASPDQELRSIVCVPLVRVRTSSAEETCVIASKDDTIGLIYLDAAQTALDLSSGNSELLQTLALEASTVLENARLLEQERAKRRMEEELAIAREIQTDLLPRKLPTAGWFRVAGSSVPSHQVGGDCFDVRQIGPSCWSTVVTDISGKGVSSALLAALVQGSFLVGAEEPAQIEQLLSRVNHFLNERTEGEKYATLFYCTIQEKGTLRWANAGHCTPFLVRRSGELLALKTTGMPLGMLPESLYGVEELRLQAGDKILIYSDGLTEAQDLDGQFFDAERLKQILRSNAQSSFAALHDKLMREIRAFTEDAIQNDDITAVVIEYNPS